MSIARNLANLIGNIKAGGGGVNRNLVINGAMNVAQRGTSVTGIGTSKNNAYHTVDRFRLAFNNTDGQVTMTQDSSAPEGFANSIKLACTATDTSIAADEYFFMDTKLEGQNLQTIAKGTSSAKPLALSFYVKGNASATYVVELYDSDNNRNLSNSFSVTTDWQRVEIAIPADTTGTFDDDNAESLNMAFWLHAGSNFTSGTLDTTWGSNTNANRAVGISSFLDSTSRTFFITGVQLEVGQNPTEFEHEPFEATLRKCQRFFCQTFNYGTEAANNTATNGAFMHGDSASNYEPSVTWRYPVEMNHAPDITLFNPESGSTGQWSAGGGVVGSAGRALFIGTSSCVCDNTDTKLAGGNGWRIQLTADCEL